MNKVKVEDLKCFDQVADVIGKSRAKVELFKVVSELGPGGINDKPYINSAFQWDDTERGYTFWFLIDCGVIPQFD